MTKTEKRLYDMEYRRRNRAMLKAKKAAYHRRTYDPVKAAIQRKAKMSRHIEYCRDPEYKVWKAAYDRKLRASEYGPFAEVYELLLELEREIKSREPSYYQRHREFLIERSSRYRKGKFLHENIISG